MSKVARKIIQIDEERCNGCGQCVTACAEGAIKIIDGKARVISDNLCDGLGACIGECPQDALKIIEREADEFDEAAVEKHLQAVRHAAEADESPCGCPSARVQQFADTPHAADDTPDTATPSALTNWPVQIRLIPPGAPFLKNADLLVASDCTAFSAPDFHRRFLPGKTLLIGCPKFDHTDMYVQKFTEIFSKAGIKRVTVAVMEVPCCHGMPRIVKAGMQAAGVKVPMETIIISMQGEIIETIHDAA